MKGTGARAGARAGADTGARAGASRVTPEPGQRRPSLRERCADDSGQALVEQAILLATLLGALVVGGLWLMRTHPEMIHALDVQVRGFYFVLSLPFP